MFDLKAQLLAKGLVTKEQVAKADDERKKASVKYKEKDFIGLDRKKALSQLMAQSKAEQYITIRKWVDVNRLDKPQAAGLDDEKFFFQASDQVTWLTVKKEVIEALAKGDAGIIAYMSNHGLTHAVVTRDIAEDVGQVFPDWLRVLNPKS